MAAHWKDGTLRDPTKVLSNPKIGKLFDPASVAIRTLARFGFTFDVVPVPSEKTKGTSDGVGLEMSIALLLVDPPGPVISGKKLKVLAPRRVSPE